MLRALSRYFQEHLPRRVRIAERFFRLPNSAYKKVLIPSLVGGLLGALLLLYTPMTIFAGLVPSLILFATIIFTIGNFAPMELIERIKVGPRAAAIALFAIAVYGGYFGGGIGFLLLAAFTL